VKKSFTALAELKPARYSKSELVGVSFDAIVPAAPPAPDNTATMVVPADPSKPAVTGTQITAPAAPAYTIPKPPARANAEYARAMQLMRSDPTQAMLEFQVLTQSYPDLPGPFANLGLLYRNANQLPEAEAALAKATERARWDAATWTEYGITLRQAGKFAEARAAYEKALEANPSYAPAHRNLGVLLDLYLDDPVTAQNELEAYKQLTGEDKPVSSWIAELRSRNKASQPRPAEPEPAPATSPSPEGAAPPPPGA
jgi:Flp pilus assembly protein TadD